LRKAVEAARFIWTHPSNRGQRARKLAQALVFQVRGRVFGRPTVARVGERSRVLIHPGRGQAGLLYANPPELPEINVWRRHLRRSPGLFLDIGANVGAYTLWAIEAGCEVIAVEPDGWAAEQLLANLALNGYQATVISAAIADKPGSVRMTTDRGVTNRIVEEGYAGATEVVRAMTIDEILGGRTAVGAKVDVEGAEMSVVLGAARALAEKRIHLMQLEWTSASDTFGIRREDIAAALDVHGYELLRPTIDGELEPPAHVGPQQPDLFARPR
jgi:FkbM family methyltransferase